MNFFPDNELRHFTNFGIGDSYELMNSQELIDPDLKSKLLAVTYIV